MATLLLLLLTLARAEPPAPGATTSAATRETNVSALGSTQPMTQEGLAAVLMAMSDEITGGPTAWEFTVHGSRLLCITDKNADRMRIISPIAKVADLPPGTMAKMMDANFHSALDARYATSDGIVYAAYIHPLSPLTTEQARSAVVQVVNLVNTFGTEWTSTTMRFTGGTP